MKFLLPSYDLDKIKFATDRPTYKRAVDLYETGKVRKFKEDVPGFSAVVIGTKPYNVFVSNKHYDQGNCECYLGSNDTLCKHMVATAIYAVLRGKPVPEESKKLPDGAAFSGRKGELSKDEFSAAKKSISFAMKFITPYRGPSRLWFAYQNSLSEGSERLSAIISDLPASEQTARLIVQVLLRLDKKLCVGGVDDSDGSVGRFITEAVDLLMGFVKLDPSCARAFRALKNIKTCFGWEEPLLKLIS